MRFMEDFSIFLVGISSFILGMLVMALIRFKIIEPRRKYKSEIKVCNYGKCQKPQSERYRPYCSNSHSDLAIGLT